MSGALLTAAEEEAMERAFLLGLARTPVARLAALQGLLADESVPLAALALMVQRRRFERPAVAADRLSRAPLLPPDPRPLLPPPCRDALLRLLAMGDRAGSDLIAPALFGLLAAHGRRVHPFDLPRLEPWLRKADQRLGVNPRGSPSCAGGAPAIRTRRVC